jgi:hypothetical protein
MIVTARLEFNLAALTAQKNPAAPPQITTSFCLGTFMSNNWYLNWN